LYFNMSGRPTTKDQCGDNGEEEDQRTVSAEIANGQGGRPYYVLITLGDLSIVLIALMLSPLVAVAIFAGVLLWRSRNAQQWLPREERRRLEREERRRAKKQRAYK
jgi:hypothetical protein